MQVKSYNEKNLQTLKKNKTCNVMYFDFCDLLECDL